MRILFLWRLSCKHSYKYSSLMYSTYGHFPTANPLLEPSSLRTSLHFASFRKFSWQEIYYSVSASTPVQTLQHSLLDLHDYSGFPWWAVIMLTTLGIRSCLIFPLAVHQNQVIARFTNLNAELKKMAPELNKEVNIARKMYGWNDTVSRNVFKNNMQNYRQKFIVRDNCHPFKIVLLSIFQIPIWVCFSISVRNLTMLSSVMQDGNPLYEQFKSEGILWFTDLTVPDVFIIPFLLASVNLILIEIHALKQIGKGSKFQKALLYGMRAMVILMAGVAALNPASVSFYWLCSSTFGLVQNLLLMHPRFRRLLRIPHTPTESTAPFKDISVNFSKRFFHKE